MVGIRMFESCVKHGLGWWNGLARVLVEFDIDSQAVKVAVCFNGLEMIVTDTVTRMELCQSLPGPLFETIGKRAAGCMNEYSERRFGYVPSKAC